MRKTITAIIMVLMVMVVSGYASTTPTKYSSSPQIKILFCDVSVGLSEDSQLMPASSWIMGSQKGTLTIQDMYSQGWKLVQIIPYNSNAAKQFYLVFQK